MSVPYVLGPEETMTARRNHDSQRRDRILGNFIRPKLALLSPASRTRKVGERQSTGDGALKLQISVASRGRTCPEDHVVGFFHSSSWKSGRSTLLLWGQVPVPWGVVQKV